MLNTLAKMAVAMGWEQEQQPDILTHHNQTALQLILGLHLHQMVPSTARLAMEGTESTL